MTDHTTGAAVRHARKRAGLTLRELAAEVGVSVGTMSAIENDKVAVTVTRLEGIAAAVGTSSARLLAPEWDERLAPSSPAVRGAWRQFGELELSPVLRAAADVFAETGYHGATMRLVAHAAGISVAGIYHHHRSKQQLLVALFDTVVDELHWRLGAAAAESDDPARCLRAMIEALALVNAERRQLVFIAATEVRSLEEPDRTRLTGAFRQLQDAVDRVVRRGARTGTFATLDSARMARALVDLCLASPSWRAPAGTEDAAAVARGYADMALVMVGLRAA
ncbi:TetR family transcriptional regulator [Patulibacter sp. S7RM1-6]